MKKLNNKGYMLIEIILAFVLAIGITYFITDLVIKLKNKNDDLLVKTLVSTDQAIIYNTIMDSVYEGNFSCDKIVIDGNKFIYNGETISVVSEYADIEFDSSNTDYCDDTNDEVKIYIPIDVKQLDDDFDVKIGLGDGTVGNTTLSCELELTSDNVVKLTDDFSFSGRIICQNFGSSCVDERVTSKTISGVGTYTYYIKAKSGLTEATGSCGIIVSNTEPAYSCPDGYDLSGTTCSKTDNYYATKSYSCDCGGNMVDGACNGWGFSSYYDTDGGCQSYCYANYDAVCSYSFGINYSCPNGGDKYLLSTGGYGCSKTTKTDATVSTGGCSGEFTKANESYCWKVVE